MRSKEPAYKAAYWKQWATKNRPRVQRSCPDCGGVFYASASRQKKCEVCKFNICLTCGDQFRANRYAARYCSRRCKDKSQLGIIPLGFVNHRGTKPRTYHLRARDKHGSAFDRDWRIAVFERDNYTCEHCGQRGGKLHADHIKPYKEFPGLRHELSNGRTLCVPCHKKTPTYGWSKYWYGKRNEIAAKRMAQEVLKL